MIYNLIFLSLEPNLQDYQMKIQDLLQIDFYFVLIKNEMIFLNLIILQTASKILKKKYSKNSYLP